MVNKIKTNITNRAHAQPRLSKLEKEIRLLRSFLIGIAGKDKEGNYRPGFVKKILKSAQEKEKCVFKNSKSFLSRLRK